MEIIAPFAQLHRAEDARAFHDFQHHRVLFPQRAPALLDLPVTAWIRDQGPANLGDIVDDGLH